MNRTLLALALMVASASSFAEPWTYRGTLNDNGLPANGRYDLRLTLLDEAKLQSIASPVVLYDFEVKDGRFAVEVDFGVDLSDAPAMRLETEVAPRGGAFAVLGEPTRFDPKGALGGVCWDTSGNRGATAGILIGNDDTSIAKMDIRNGFSVLHFEQDGGLGQGNGLATARHSVALHTSTAGGIESFSAGRGTVAPGHDYSVMFGGASNSSISTTAPDQFVVRAAGGVGINGAPRTGPFAFDELTLFPVSTDTVDSVDLFLRQKNTSDGIQVSVGNGTGSNNSGFSISNFNGTTFCNRMNLAPNGFVQIKSSTNCSNTGVSMAAGGGSWSSLSDRRLKTAVEAVDTRAILDRLLAMPMNTWSYIAQGAGIRHIGPMAQDFAQQFEVGENDTSISTIDADGVALAAIQGLNAKLEADNALLRTDAESMRAQLAQVLARLQRVEANQER